jgi:S1-C subfamily serine protease
MALSCSYFGIARGRLIVLVVLACLSAIPASSAGPENPVRAAARSVVGVLPAWTSRPPNAAEPEGSGVVVGDGTLVLTADHILGNAVRVRVRTGEGDIAEVRIVARDGETDLALLKMPFALEPLTFEGYPETGDRTCAIGNAFGLGTSASCGTVSAVRRSGVGFNPIEDFIQTDAAVNPGMSGGALVDGDGALVGILSAIFTKQSDANIGVNFAVSAPLAALALERMQVRDAQPWPRAGLQLRPFPPRGGIGRAGAVIVDIAPGSAASNADLEVGDVITQAGSRRIFGPADLRAAVAMQKSGEPLAITLLRGQDEHKAQITIAE